MEVMSGIYMVHFRYWHLLYISWKQELGQVTFLKTEDTSVSVCIKRWCSTRLTRSDKVSSTMDLIWAFLKTVVARVVVSMPKITDQTVVNCSPTNDNVTYNTECTIMSGFVKEMQKGVIYVYMI